MASQLTGNQIITQALEQAGNPSLTTLAQTWLNNILDRLYEDSRWPWQEKQLTAVLPAGSTVITLPGDFIDLWNKQGLKLIDQTSGATRSLIFLTHDEYDVISVPTTPGPPTHFEFTYSVGAGWRPFPTPDKDYNYTLRYKFKPARVTNFDATVSFPNDDLLVQAVYVRALQHEDDARYQVEAEVLAKMIGSYLRQFNISPLRGANVAMRVTTFPPLGFFR